MSSAFDPKTYVNRRRSSRAKRTALIKATTALMEQTARYKEETARLKIELASEEAKLQAAKARCDASEARFEERIRAQRDAAAADNTSLATTPAGQ